MMRAPGKQTLLLGGDLTPAEGACSPAERVFCFWLLNFEPVHGYRVKAYRMSGLGANSTPHTLNSAAQVLLNKQRIIDLITEMARKQIRAAAPIALHAVNEIINDPTHRDRLKAAQTILERVEPTLQRFDVNVRH